MRSTRPLTVLVACLLLAGCGVRPDGAPRRLDGVELPSPAAASASALARPAAVRIYLVRDRVAVPVNRLVDTPATAERRLAALAAGPTDREAAAGLRTALAGGIRFEQVTTAGRIASVALAASFVDAGTEEQILALTQIVYSVTELRDVEAVRFSVDGADVSVPRADGSLAAGPVARTDYAALVGR